MERLTARKVNGVRGFLLPDDLKTQSLIYQKLAEYEDLDEEGLIFIVRWDDGAEGEADTENETGAEAEFGADGEFAIIPEDEPDGGN